jgi:transcription antitermination factor NusG
MGTQHLLDVDSRWYAVWTRSNHERAAAATLHSLGIPHYLPLHKQTRQWSDRKQSIEVPLFPGYLFVHLDPASPSRLAVLKTPGVAGFVGNSFGPSPIPDREIEFVRAAVRCGANAPSTPAWTEGDRVRVVRGALAGAEGTLLRIGSKSQLIVSISIIQRSVAVTISEEDVERLAVAATTSDC